MTLRPFYLLRDALEKDIERMDKQLREGNVEVTNVRHLSHLISEQKSQLRDVKQQIYLLQTSKHRR